MSAYIKSLGYALEGLFHAFTTERNLKLFGMLYIISLAAGYVFKIDRRDWEFLFFAGGVFLTIELINTALEHFTDAFDTHSKNQNDIHTHAIKCTKDIAAGASLVCLLAWGSVLAIIFWPHIVG